MEYSFDKVIDRRGSGCIKWDYNPEVLEAFENKHPEND